MFDNTDEGSELSFLYSFPLGGCRNFPPSGVGFSWAGVLIVIERFLPWPLV